MILWLEASLLRKAIQIKQINNCLLLEIPIDPPSPISILLTNFTRMLMALD